MEAPALKRSLLLKGAGEDQPPDEVLYGILVKAYAVFNTTYDGIMYHRLSYYVLYIIIFCTIDC